MQLQTIPLEKLSVNINDLWDRKWFLLTCGDFASGQYNTMTVSWGSLGIIWNRPFAQVVVRPVRHTFHFIETYDTFTLCALPDPYRRALNLLGTKSGRDGDKIKEAGLSLTASIQVAAPVFAEAELVMECRKLYWDDFDPSHFLDPGIEKFYPQNDYHRIYYGEVLTARGIAAYLG